MLAVTLAGIAVNANAQDQRKEAPPEYFEVYESAFHETSKLGLNPTEKIYVSNVDIKPDNFSIRFREPLNGPAIINIYDDKGRMLVNQYVEMNGARTQFPLYNHLSEGIRFIHVFTEKAEVIYQYNYSHSTSN